MKTNKLGIQDVLEDLEFTDKQKECFLFALKAIKLEQSGNELIDENGKKYDSAKDAIDVKIKELQNEV